MKKYYENKIFIIVIQTLSIVLIGFAEISSIFKLLLVFGYIMLFRLNRWHKHLLIMFIMLCIMSMSSGGINSLLQIIQKG